MPKDTKKNRYFQIGMGWDSWTLAQLEKDARLHQMDDQPAKLVVLRLTEYYTLVEKGAIIPGVTAMMQPSLQVQQASGTNGTMPANNNGTRGGSTAAPAAVPKQDQEEEANNTVAESEAAEQNADEALDYFMMDDDE
jgi:hypothetical protein